MGRLNNISGREAVKAFEKAGWVIRNQTGSHLILTQAGVRANLTVPLHNELAVGTLRALIKASGLSVDEFLEML
jgi:predicted RNA binding protein YcfA (HicA-like mRNA interferase family)